MAQNQIQNNTQDRVILNTIITEQNVTESMVHVIKNITKIRENVFIILYENVLTYLPLGFHSEHYLKVTKYVSTIRYSELFLRNLLVCHP